MNTLTHLTASTYQAAGFFSFIDEKVNAAQATIGGVIGLVAIVIALVIFATKRNIVGLVMAIIIGAVGTVLGGIIMSASGIFEQEFQTGAAAPQSIVGEHPDALSGNPLDEGI